MLGGCFVSKQGVIQAADTAFPFADGAKYAASSNCAKSPLLDCTGYKETESGVLRVKDGAYILQADPGSNPVYSLPAMKDATPPPIALQKIGPDLYLGQTRLDAGDSDKPAFAYFALRTEGKAAFTYVFQCEENGDKKYVTSGALAAISNEMLTPTCEAKDAAGLAAVFNDRLAGGAEPDAKYVFN